MMRFHFKRRSVLPGFGLTFGFTLLYLSTNKTVAMSTPAPTPFKYPVTATIDRISMTRKYSSRISR